MISLNQKNSVLKGVHQQVITYIKSLDSDSCIYILSGKAVGPSYFLQYEPSRTIISPRNCRVRNNSENKWHCVIFSKLGGFSGMIFKIKSYFFG